MLHSSLYFSNETNACFQELGNDVLNVCPNGRTGIEQINNQRALIESATYCPAFLRDSTLISIRPFARSFPLTHGLGLSLCLT